MERARPSAAAIERSRVVRHELLELSTALRKNHPFLEHQNALGMTVFVVSIAAILANAVAYARGAVPAWVAIPVAAFFMSLLHELEHDLIHRLYFPRNKVVYDLMMAGVWLFRPSTINPWLRASWHLHHHKVSGQTSDVEERAITNGEPWGLRRLLMTGDGMLAVLLRPRTVYTMIRAFIDEQNPATPEERKALARSNRLAFFPLGTMHYALLHGFVAYHAGTYLLASLGQPFVPTGSVASVIGFVDFLAVVLLLPNALRTFCLHFVSSNIHYYGDNEPGNVVEQTQVWNAWFLFPLQLFCFNFGSTHAIHHFAVRDPFYVRQMIARDAHRVLRAHGVRFNDFASMGRANRLHAASQEAIASETPLASA